MASTHVRGAALLTLALAVLGRPSLTQPRGEALPRTVRPFPSGLSGTLVFQSDVTGRPAIYTLALESGTVTALTGGATFTSTTPRWSPDGTRVAFSSNRAHYDGVTRDTGVPDADVWVVGADGRGAARLTNDPANETDPDWSDGHSIVYSSDRDSRGDLFSLRLTSGVVTRLTNHFVGRAIMPASSPDGRRITFAAQSLRMGAFWSYQVHLLTIGGAATALESTAGGCWPSWSPDGRRLAHVRLAPGEPSSIEIRDGTRFEQSKVQKADGLWSYYPTWSPDGSQLALSVSPAHHEGENWDLAVMDPHTGTWARLTEGAGNDRLPDWKR